MTFTGIPLTALDFYEDLENDNSKTFWRAHKQVYDESVRAPLEALATALEPEFGAAKFFRPYRDVRFSKDKTPYKTQQGVWFATSRRYLHVGAAGLFIAGGYWSTTSEEVARLRRAAADDVAGGQLERAVAAVRRKGFTIGGEATTRIPSGYPRDHPRAEWIKHKTLTVGRDLGAPPWLSTPAARARIAASWRAMTPLVDWLSTHVG